MADIQIHNQKKFKVQKTFYVNSNFSLTSTTIKRLFLLANILLIGYFCAMDLVFATTENSEILEERDNKRIHLVITYESESSQEVRMDPGVGEEESIRLLTEAAMAGDIPSQYALAIEYIRIREAEEITTRRSFLRPSEEIPNLTPQNEYENENIPVYCSILMIGAAVTKYLGWW